MAANLDIREDGTAAVVSVGETPWHRQGTIVLDRTSDAARRIMTDLDHALELGGLNFTVEKLPVVAERDGQKLKSRGCGVYRTDRWTCLGNVGEDYGVLQNAEAFGVARPILEKGLATIETGGALDGGADVWLLMRMVPSKLMAAAEEAIAGKYSDSLEIVRRVDMLDLMLAEILPFMHLSNHHGGRRAATVQETGIRVCCSNTQAAALDGNAEGIRIVVPHTSEVKARYEAAAGDVMKKLALRYLSLSETRVKLRGRVLTQEEFEALVLETAVPVKHLDAKIRQREGDKASKATLNAIERNHELRDEIHRLWTAGKGHEGNRSAWEALQGLIEFVDHSPKARASGDRLASLTRGTLGRVKSRVFADLCALVAEEEG